MQVDGSSFEQDVVERSRELPVIVDFWAPWCGPCHALAPVLERAVAEREGVLALAKLDVDENQELAERYGVRGIPAVKAFRNGNVVAEFVGAQPQAVVDAFVAGLVGPTEAEQLIAELEERGELPDVTSAYREVDHERALARLLDEVRIAGDDRREELRRLMVALFAELGQEHPVATEYRRRLAAALY